MGPTPQNGAASVWGGPIAVHSTLTNPFQSDVSTADTIRILRELAHQYAHDPSVQMANLQALSGLRPGASQRDMAGAIFYYVRGRVHFVEDERLMYEQLGVEPAHLDKELLLTPPLLLNMPVPMGDCDDFSLLLASMLLCAGLQPYFVTVAADASEPRKFSHIYICVRLEDEGGYQCLDAGNRLVGIPPGWEISKVSRKAIWAI